MVERVSGYRVAKRAWIRTRLPVALFEDAVLHVTTFHFYHSPQSAQVAVSSLIQQSCNYMNLFSRRSRHLHSLFPSSRQHSLNMKQVSDWMVWRHRNMAVHIVPGCMAEAIREWEASTTTPYFSSVMFPSAK